MKAPKTIKDNLIGEKVINNGKKLENMDNKELMRLIDTYAKLRLLAPDGKHAKKLYKQLSLVVLNLFKLTISASFTFFSRLTCSRV